MEDGLAPVRITIFYHKELMDITGKDTEEIIISRNTPFIWLLKILFDTYPELMKNYPPGELGLLVNGKPPKDYDFFSEGDVVELVPFGNLLT